MWGICLNDVLGNLLFPLLILVVYYHISELPYQKFS